MIHFISMVFIVMTLNSHKYHHNHHWHRNHHHCHEMIIIMVIMGVIVTKYSYITHCSTGHSLLFHCCYQSLWRRDLITIITHQPITLCGTIVNIHIRAHLNIWNNICRMTSAAHRWSQSSSSSDKEEKTIIQKQTWSMVWYENPQKPANLQRSFITLDLKFLFLLMLMLMVFFFKCRVGIKGKVEQGWLTQLNASEWRAPWVHTHNSFLQKS